ncbi:MAG: glycine cleavage T C-terminal barrel domain-containing protein [Actinomycetota bacterium]
MTQETFTFYIAPWYRKSPFFDATKRYGCKSWGLYNHMLLPTLYDDPVTEYWALLNDVTVWDVAVERIVEITGPDAFDFTNMLTCRDLTTCRVGQCKYAPLIARRGGIVNDPVLLRLGESHFWLALADSDAALYAKGVAACAGMDIDIDQPDVSPLQVQGPRSTDVMVALFGEGIAGLRYYWCDEPPYDIPLIVSRTGWTGEVGYELYLRDGSRGDDLWERVMEAGKPFGIRAIAPSEARRIEAGIFNYGSDITMENTPFEVTGFERLVEPQEADYIGKEALTRIAAKGVQRKLVGVDIGGEPMTAEGALSDFWPVQDNGEEIGCLTAGTWSPRLDRNIGYAWVPIGLAEAGTRLEAASPAGPVLITVAALPFVDPSKNIPRS